MVKNREELLRVASRNANQLKNEVSRGLKAFMSAKQVRVTDLARVLGISPDHLNGIVRGTAQLNVDDLSKILVALDLAVEIKPVGATPLGSYGDGMPLGGPMPRNGGRSMPSFEEFEKEMLKRIPTPEEVDEMRKGHSKPRPNGRMPHGGIPLGMPMPFPMPGMPMMGEHDEPVAVRADEPQPRDERGRFVRRNATRPSAAPNGGEFEMLSDDELKDIILRNLWDGEIDVNRASHGALAAFVNRKDMLMKQRSNGNMPAPEEEDKTPLEPMAVEEDVRAEREFVGAPRSERSGKAVNSFLEALSKIAEAVENDPRLADTFERFMPKR